MPQQEVFFAQTTGERRVEVLKTYDQRYALEVFNGMDEFAQTHLWESLGMDEAYESAGVAPTRGPVEADFLWEELLDAAREDGSLFSFFVVKEENGTIPETLYVSPDWPSAEAFAKKRIAANG